MEATQSKWVVVLLICIGVGFPLSVNAQMTIRAEELTTLPPYCKYSNDVGRTPNEFFAEWRVRMGEGCRGWHHYCWALVSLNRTFQPRIKPQQREFLHKEAIADINYVVKNSDGGQCRLMPEILTKRGNSEAFLKRYADAEKSYREALGFLKDYWPAYRGLAEIFLAQGRRADARSVLEDGIKHSSDTTALKRMLDELRP